MNKTLLELKDITKTYITGTQKYQALKGINIQIFKNEFVCIMGPSGSGKSTLLHILGCLDIPSTGKYILDGVDVKTLNDNQLSHIRNQKIGFVFQAFNLLPKINIYNNVMLPFIYSNIPQNVRKERVMDALEKVGLADKLNNMPNQISGGQKQRVAIARSLVMNPSIILADEPTGNLDTKTGDQVMDIFTKINKTGATVILITHEPDIAKFGTRTIVIKDGLIESDKQNKK